MSDIEQIREVLYDTIGDEGCGVSCDQADIFKDSDGWKMQLCSFMGPWKLGGTVEEATATIKELASQGYGLA